MIRSVALRAGGVFAVLAVPFLLLSILGNAPAAHIVSLICMASAISIFLLAALIPQRRLVPIRTPVRKRRPR